MSFVEPYLGLFNRGRRPPSIFRFTPAKNIFISLFPYVVKRFTSAFAAYHHPTEARKLTKHDKFFALLLTFVKCFSRKSLDLNFEEAGDICARDFTYFGRLTVMKFS